MTPTSAQAPCGSLLSLVERGAERQLAVCDAGWRRSAVLGACVGMAHWLLTTARCVIFFAAGHSLHFKHINTMLKHCRQISLTASSLSVRVLSMCRQAQSCDAALSRRQIRVLVSLIACNAVLCRGDDVLQFPIVHRPRFFRLRSEVPQSGSSCCCHAASLSGCTPLLCMAAGMGFGGRGFNAVVQAKAAVLLSHGLDDFDCGIEFAAGSEVESGPGKGHSFVPATLRQLLCSQCVLLQLVCTVMCDAACNLWQLWG